MSNDTPLVQLLIGRWGSAITGLASLVVVLFGTQITGADQTTITDAGSEVIRSGHSLYAAGLALISVVQALISRYKKRK